MKAGTPKPFDLGYFTTTRRIWTGVPQWEQVKAWQRAGTVSIMPAPQENTVAFMQLPKRHRSFADVVLTDKGREELGRIDAALAHIDQVLAQDAEG